MSDRLKILHICSSLAWGGGEMSAVKLAASFKEEGDEIYFAAHPKGRISAELRKAGINPINTRLLRNLDPVSSMKLRFAVRRYGIEIIHVHMSRDLVHAYLATSMMRKPPRIILQKQVSSKVLKKDLFHRLIYSRVDKVFVLSNYLRQNILDTCPVSEDKVTVIPGGIDADDYGIDPGESEKIRLELGIRSDSLVIGSVTRIDRAKGLTELVAAVSRLPAVFADVRLVIVGEPTYGEEKYYRELRDMVDSSGLNEKVMFVGYRSDIPRIFSIFDIFALPSYEEAFGYVFIEAMAAGLPVVASDAGGVPDIITDGETGILVPPAEIEPLSAAIFKLLNDKELRNRMGAEGKKKARKVYSESKILNAYREEYRSLLE